MSFSWHHRIKTERRHIPLAAFPSAHEPVSVISSVWNVINGIQLSTRVHKVEKANFNKVTFYIEIQSESSQSYWKKGNEKKGDEEKISSLQQKISKMLFGSENPPQVEFSSRILSSTQRISRKALVVNITCLHCVNTKLKVFCRLASEQNGCST